MKRKKELIVILSSLLVIVLSVSVAYFTTKILGTGKEISVESADLKVIFTSGSGTINGSNIEPGWSSGENTFTVKNESNGTYKYNIIIKDLVNTFVTEGFLQYKITSSDGGYTMSDFVDVPKSSIATDTILAENINIEKGATHTYKIIINYNNSEDVDQSTDMGKILSGKIFIEKSIPTLVSKLLEDNPTIGIRSDFSTPFTTNTTNTLYKATENGSEVYYFSGIENTDGKCVYNNNGIITEINSLTGVVTKDMCVPNVYLCNDNIATSQSECMMIDGNYHQEELYWSEGASKPINNWVKFGKWQNDMIKYRGYVSSTSLNNYKDYNSMVDCTSATSYNKNCTEIKYARVGDDMYWRIIRTNSDGSIRLLYSGTSPDTTEGYIDTSAFNTNGNSPKYAGYMYGNSDTTLEEARTNTNDSTIKTYIDTWYANNLTSYTNYLSNDAIYCNDRELASGSTYSTSSDFNFKSYDRLQTNKIPTYDCANTKNAFSVNNAVAKLKYPIALMTADEISYAGGVYGQNAPMWYYTNSTYNSITGSYYGWWLLSPSLWGFSLASVWEVVGVNSPSALNNFAVKYSNAVRPVTSLKSCVQWKSGDGSASNPYEIVENGGC